MIRRTQIKFQLTGKSHLILNFDAWIYKLLSILNGLKNDSCYDPTAEEISFKADEVQVGKIKVYVSQQLSISQYI